MITKKIFNSLVFVSLLTSSIFSHPSVQAHQHGTFNSKDILLVLVLILISILTFRLAKVSRYFKKKSPVQFN